MMSVPYRAKYTFQTRNIHKVSDILINRWHLESVLRQNLPLPPISSDNSKFSAVLASFLKTLILKKTKHRSYFVERYFEKNYSVPPIRVREPLHEITYPGLLSRLYAHNGKSRCYSSSSRSKIKGDHPVFRY